MPSAMARCWSERSSRFSTRSIALATIASRVTTEGYAMPKSISLDNIEMQELRLLSLVFWFERDDRAEEMEMAYENDPNARQRTVRELVAYFVLAFAITYGIGAGFIFFRP